MEMSLTRCYIWADRHKLGQVVSNLVSNALKFTPRGGVVTVSMAKCVSRSSLKQGKEAILAPVRRLSHVSETVTGIRYSFNRVAPHSRRSSLAAPEHSVSQSGQMAIADAGFAEGELLLITVTDSGAGISAVRAPSGFGSYPNDTIASPLSYLCHIFTQANQVKLFKEVVQFNPGKLQAGGGSGLGLYSKLPTNLPADRSPPIISCSLL